MKRRTLLLSAIVFLGACHGPEKTPISPPDFYGTQEPFASDSVYFIVTDRFVDGDPANNQEAQGGTELATFDRPIQLDGLPPANIGYLGGDFKGVLDNAGYIADMGFTAAGRDQAGAGPAQGGVRTRGRGGGLRGSNLGLSCRHRGRKW